MTKNDKFFKILFAIELALLPIVFFVYRMATDWWATGIVIAGILLVKIWMELFKDNSNITHTIIDGVGSVAVFATLFIFLICIDVLSKPLTIIVLVLIVLMNVLLSVFFKSKMPEFISAVDFCYMLFECFTILSLTFVEYYSLIAYIGLYALLLTTLVSVCYKLYYSVRYTKLLSIFKRKK